MKRVFLYGNMGRTNCSGKAFRGDYNAKPTTGMEHEMLKTDAIIFDLDGTLWDSTEPAAVVWKDVASRYPEITDEITGPRLKTFYGLPLEDIARGMFTSVPFEQALSVMEICVKEQCPYLVENKGELLGDIEGTLRALKERGFKLFIVSNCRAGYIEAFLEGHKFGYLIDDHLCPGDTGELKAANIRNIIDRWQLKAPVYMGDTQGDKDASTEAGVPFIFARYGFGTADGWDEVADSFEQLTQLVER